MTPIDLDHGERCDDHVGEAFRVRCAACDQAAQEAQAAEQLRTLESAEQERQTRHDRAVARASALAEARTHR